MGQLCVDMQDNEPHVGVLAVLGFEARAFPDLVVDGVRAECRRPSCIPSECAASSRDPLSAQDLSTQVRPLCRLMSFHGRLATLLGLRANRLKLRALALWRWHKVLTLVVPSCVPE